MSLDLVTESPAQAHVPGISAGETSPTMMLAALAALSSTAFPSPAIAIRAYLDLLARLIGVRSTFVSQIDSSAQLIIDSYDDHGCAVQADQVVPLEETFCQHVRATGAPVIIGDTASDIRVIDIARRNQLAIGAYIGVPLLLSNGTLFGTLCAMDPQPCQFHQAHVDLLRVAASQIAALIEREGLHRQIDQTSDTAEQLSTARHALDHQTELLHVVAHDIRAPLATITGYTSLLKTGLFGQVAGRQAEVLEQIGLATRFINRMANDLVDSTAAETHKLTLIVEDFDPQALAEQVLAGCQFEAQRKGLTLIQRCTAAPTTIAGDPDRLQQVLLNLMSNALRYTERGSITLALTTSSADTIEFRVEDTGPGIAAELQQQIWQRYARATAHGSGIGLGLYVVRQLVSAMGGTAGVESAPGYGACFWVRLPLHGVRPQSFQWS